MIDISGLSVRFGGLDALRDVTLSFQQPAAGGGIFGLIGPNGAGKTTLLNCLTGFVRADSGSIVIDGVDVTALSTHGRARLGVVRSFQTVRLLEEETLMTNLLVGCYRFNRGALVKELLGLSRRDRQAQARSVLDVAGMLGFDPRDLSRSVSTLPFGMRRMAELGRVVLAKPKVALFDEPASGLAEDQRAQLGTVLRRLADEFGVMVLMTEHDMDFVRELCVQIAVLDSGQRIAYDTPDEALSLPSVQNAYFGTHGEAHA